MQPEGSRIYEVRAERDGKIYSRGARQERPAAEELLRRALVHAESNRLTGMRFWVEEVDTAGLFQLPSRPTPRERYTTRVTAVSRPDAWESMHVDVLDGDAIVASYERNYTMLQTFEPFRQGERTYALISPDYTATSVIDLESGLIIAGEEPADDGFCPVGFYVPDWWDVHDGSILPGSMQWRSEDHEWPLGDFGFVWGCVWGDDNSWKVQYLDLSLVGEGLLRRDERFGYLPLASRPDVPARQFIRCSSWHGSSRVTFDVPQKFDLSTGELIPVENPWDP